MKRPLALTIVGAVWFLFGLAGLAANTVQHQGLAIPDTNFFYLVVGAGLLKGWRWCRWYALLVTGVGFVLGLCYAPWMLIHTERFVIHFPTILFDGRPHEAVLLPLVVILMVVYLTVSAWVFTVLMRRDVKQYFAPLVPAAIR